MHTFPVNTLLHRLVAAFSWMLIHSLWQGLVLAALVAIIYVITRNRKAAVRYNLLIFIFAGWLFAALYTFIGEWNTAGTVKKNADATVDPGMHFTQLFFGHLQPLRKLLNVCNEWITMHETLIALAWFIIFGARIIKLAGALAYNQHMKSKQVTVASAYWQNTVSRICSALQINKVVLLLESGCMKVPVVIGHLKPVILMPLGLLMSFSPAQAEAILLHELAHIKRNDYLVNFLQCVAETLFFFNPAVWYISSCIREERENCCDDIALEQTQDKIGLAEALIGFKHYQLNGNAYQTAFPGKKNQLLRRVNRILGNGDKQVLVREKIFFAAGLIMLLMAAGAVILSQGRQAGAIPFSITNTAGPLLAKDTTIVPVVNNSTQKKATRKMIAAERKIAVIPPKLMIVKAVTDITAATPPYTIPLTNEQMALMDMARAKKDQVQAKKDQVQAIKDQVMAKLDQHKALLDQKQAMLDQAKANRDQHQAATDQEAAALQQEQLFIDKQKALLDKEAAERKINAQPVL